MGHYRVVWRAIRARDGDAAACRRAGGASPASSTRPRGAPARRRPRGPERGARPGAGPTPRATYHQARPARRILSDRPARASPSTWVPPRRGRLHRLGTQAVHLGVSGCSAAADGSVTSWSAPPSSTPPSSTRPTPRRPATARSSSRWTASAGSTSRRWRAAGPGVCPAACRARTTRWARASRRRGVAGVARGGRTPARRRRAVGRSRAPLPATGRCSLRARTSGAARPASGSWPCARAPAGARRGRRAAGGRPGAGLPTSGLAVAAAAALDARGRTPAEDVRLAGLVERIRDRVLDGSRHAVLGDPGTGSPTSSPSPASTSTARRCSTSSTGRASRCPRGPRARRASLQPSHVLVAMGALSRATAGRRCPVGAAEADVDRLLEVLPGIVSRVRGGLGADQL